MAQFFPFLIQLMNNPTFVTMLNVAGYKFDAVAAFKNFAAFAGWKYSQDFVVQMTPEERQKADAQLPSAIQAQKGQQAQQQSVQQFQQNVREEQEKELSKAGGEVMRSAIEHGMQTDPLAQPFTGNE